MKKHFILLLTFAATACFGMNFEKNIENKELKKSIIIKHQNDVRETTLSDNRYITFGIDKVGAEIYDIKNDKIIKTVEDITWWPASPILNKYNSSFLAFERKKENTYLCSLYDLENDTEISFNTALYFRNHFVLLGNKLLSSLPNSKGYSIYDLHNTISKTISFNNEMQRYNLSHNANYLAIFLKNNMLFLGDLARNEAKLVTSESNISKFSPDSTLLAYFDQKHKVISLYDTKAYRIIDQKKTNDAIIEILFPNASTIWFSHNRQNYTIWDIENDTTTSLDLGAQAFPKPIEQLFKNFLYFITYDDDVSTLHVYNMTKKKYISLQQQGFDEYLFFNKDETYAAFATTSNLAVLYETKTWQPVTSITFENGYLNPFTFFSPCGKFLAVASIGAKWLKLYSIGKDTIIFESPWIPQRGHLQFHENGLLIFKTHDKLLSIYDYLTNKISRIDTKKEITSYKVKNNLLTISTGSTTTLFTCDDLEFTNYNDITSFEEKNSFKWIKAEKNMRFYTHEIAACQLNETTIKLYNHIKNKVGHIERDKNITWFDIQNENLIISYGEQEEYLPLKEISFEETKENENKSYCIIA